MNYFSLSVTWASPNRVFNHGEKVLHDSFWISTFHDVTFRRGARLSVLL